MANTINIIRSIRKAFGELPVVPSLLIANTDTAHYWDLTKNIFRFSPMVMNQQDTTRIHGFNERISIEGYYQAIEFYLSVIKYSATI